MNTFEARGLVRKLQPNFRTNTSKGKTRGDIPRKAGSEKKRSKEIEERRLGKVAATLGKSKCHKQRQTLTLRAETFSAFSRCRCRCYRRPLSWELKRLELEQSSTGIGETASWIFLFLKGEESEVRTRKRDLADLFFLLITGREQVSRALDPVYIARPCPAVSRVSVKTVTGAATKGNLRDEKFVRVTRFESPSDGTGPKKAADFR